MMNQCGTMWQDLIERHITDREDPRGQALRDLVLVRSRKDRRSTQFLANRDPEFEKSLGMTVSRTGREKDRTTAHTFV
jgi:hypothetical protein